MIPTAIAIKNPRIEVVDVLRGFAIMAIMLLHNVEHFEYVYTPDYFPSWLLAFDKMIWTSMFYLFGGKAYAIFALLFGFSFYIQNDNQVQSGKDFRLRFFWRMLLLLGFGYLNTAFYQGDILTLYAIFGLVLIPACRWNNKTIFVVATFLMLQPLEWLRWIYYVLHPDFVPEPNASEAYYAQITHYMQNGNFLDYVIGNVTLGKTASLLWSWEFGRFFQAPALFLFGFWAGRKQLFSSTNDNVLFWKKVLKIAFIAFIPLNIIVMVLPNVVAHKAQLSRLMIVFMSWNNVALMLVWVSLLYLAFQHEKGKRLLSKLIPFGKMSLTNYIVQSIIGSTIYYKYGLGMAMKTGATYCLLIGITLFLLQLTFCTWWLKTHKQGPLEYIWGKATWIGTKK